MKGKPIDFDYYWEKESLLDGNQLFDTCYQYVLKNPEASVYISNRGGYQSPSDMHDLQEFKSLVDVIERSSLDLHKEFEIIDEVEPYVINMWFNFNAPGSYNEPHSHLSQPSNARFSNPVIWSGTFYVKVPENSGNLFFLKGNEDLSLSTKDPATTKIPFNFLKNIDNKNIEPARVIVPIENNIYFWMSDMWHGVTENKSKNDRLSISFNIGLRMR